MGVVVCYLYRDGTFWTTSVATRPRVRALRERPQSTFVLNAAGHKRQRGHSFGSLDVSLRPVETLHGR
jgi:hypothetical protein